MYIIFNVGLLRVAFQAWKDSSTIFSAAAGATDNAIISIPVGFSLFQVLNRM